MPLTQIFFVKKQPTFHPITASRSTRLLTLMGVGGVAGILNAQTADGQAYVAIDVASWQLTADGQALVTLPDGSTLSLPSDQFQILRDQLYVLESLVALNGLEVLAAGSASMLFLGALALTSAGDGGANDSPTQAQGTALVGPLSNAFVYYDANGNGQFDTDEKYTRTNANGTYDLTLSGVTEHAPNAAVIVTTDDQTVDTGAGTVLAGITLKATAGSSVVTPLTTLMVETGLGSDALGQALGLTGNQDLSAFNPYADGVDANQALATEQASAQVASTLAGLASAAIGAGADAEAAYAAALAALRAVVEAQANAGTPLDLSQAGDAGHLDEIQTAFTENIAGAQGLDAAALDAVIGGAVQAIGTVNDAIGDLDDTNLTADRNKGAFGLIQVMQDDIEQAARTGGDVTLADITADALETLIANLAPTDIALVGVNDKNEISIAEDTGSLSVGAISATDTDADSSGSVRFEIALVDGGAVTPESSPFEIDDQNNLLFTAQPDFETKSSYRVTVHATDTGGKTYAETFVIKITDANEVPVAVVDSVSTNEDTALVIDVSDLLANDSDVDGGTLSIASVSNENNGTVVFNEDEGTITFTPTENFNGDASFEYSLSDGQGGTATGTVNVTVNAVNDAPVAVVDSVSTDEDTALVINVADLLGNDSDVDGDTLSITAVDNGNNGTVVLNEDDGTITFTPTENFNGDASFEYSLSDGQGGTATGTVNVTVNAVNDAPVAVVDSVSTDEDTALVINVADLLANDSDVDGDTLSITAVGNGNNGTVVLNEDDGTITFTPTENFNGDASFEYSLSDGQGGTATGTVNVTVNAVNDAAEITGDTSGSVAEDGTLSTAGTLRVTDVDSDEEFSVQENNSTTYGNFSINAAGAWTYSLNNSNAAVQALGDGESLTDNISVTSADGTPATISITIEGANDVAEITGNSSGSVAEDSTLSAAGTLSVTDVDSGEDVFIVQNNSTTTYGSFSINAAGAWTYTLDDSNTVVQALGDGESLTDSITVTSADGTEKTISITIEGSNNLPQFTTTPPDRIQVPENTVLTGYVPLAHDSEDGSIAVTIQNAEASAFEIDQMTGELRFKSAPDFENPSATAPGNEYSLTLLATDSTGGTTWQTVTIEIENIDDNAPAFVYEPPEEIRVPEFTTDTSFIATTFDADGDTVTLSITGRDANKFHIDSQTNRLTLNELHALDVPMTKTFNITLKAESGEDGGSTMVSHDLEIVVVDDTMIYFERGPWTTIDVPENTAIGESIYQTNPSNLYSEGSFFFRLHYTENGISATEDRDHFEVNASTGELSFLGQAPDFENPHDTGSNNSYKVAILAGQGDQVLGHFQQIFIRVTDQPEAPVFRDTTIDVSVDENQNGIVFQTLATDQDAGNYVTYSIHGPDADLFTIDENSGDVWLNAALDYETPNDDNNDNVYTLTVHATDTTGLQSSQTVNVDINNVGPNIPTDTAIDFAENSQDVVYSVTAIDGVTFSLGSSYNEDLFDFAPETGDITFNTPPDFESLTQNPLLAEIIATDTVGEQASMILSVSVTNIDEQAYFPDGDTVTVHVDEGASIDTVVFQAHAIDPEGDSVIILSSRGFGDRQDFNITNGAVKFKQVPDYETPVDADQDNEYHLQFSVLHSDNSRTYQEVTIIVQDVDEAAGDIFAVT